MKLLEISILKVVAYFDIFSYPVTADELVFFLDQPATPEEILPALNMLLETNNLYRFNNFYTTRNEEWLATRRINGNKLAVKQIKTARRIARFLYWLPFVKGIAISGSLSKNFADKNSDLDFFVITAANRLWIVRMFHTFLCKIALTIKSKDWFCPNYFIDEMDMKIHEQNIFTSVELSTLMPLKGQTIFEQFFKTNDWVHHHLPNYKPNFAYMKDSRPAAIKRFFEWIFNAKTGDKIDDRLLMMFRKRFAKVLSKNMVTPKGVTVGAYEACKHSCRPLPHYFQPKILTTFNERFNAAKDKFDFELTKAV